MSCAITAEFWAHSCVSKEPGFRSSMGRSTFEGGHVPVHYNVPTLGECACTAHAADEYIRRREW